LKERADSPENSASKWPNLKADRYILGIWPFLTLHLDSYSQYPKYLIKLNSFYFFFGNLKNCLKRSANFTRVFLSFLRNRFYNILFELSLSRCWRILSSTLKPSS
jgi:hypothetical protein